MLVAFGALILTHWAYNEPTLDVKTLVEMVFAILVVAFLDQGRTAPIAQGFAWIFLAAVLLSSKSILNALKNVKAPAKKSSAKPA